MSQRVDGPFLDSIHRVELRSEDVEIVSVTIPAGNLGYRLADPQRRLIIVDFPGAPTSSLQLADLVWLWKSIDETQSNRSESVSCIKCFDRF